MTKKFTLPLQKSQNCPIQLLELDKSNPRLQTGVEVAIKSNEELIETLADIASLDELISSICTNGYLNLEPLIVIGEKDEGPFTVLEGNRRLAAITCIRNPTLAESVGVKLPKSIPAKALETTNEVLCYRVEKEDDARSFIGFKHINGPQRWDAYAKAKYITDWYKRGGGTISISEIAQQMGDTNDTLRSYIYAILLLDQAAEAKLWSIKDRSNPGRFAFSHFYTALGRKEYQNHLGLQGSWSDTPPIKPLQEARLPQLAEVLSFIYGSKPSDQPALVRSQNPDLKDLGLAIADDKARLILKSKGSLDDARDQMKTPSLAFFDAILGASLRLKKAMDLLPKYDGSDFETNIQIEELFEQADTIKTMVSKKKGYKGNAA